MAQETAHRLSPETRETILAALLDYRKWFAPVAFCGDEEELLRIDEAIEEVRRL